jgi:hypothetical protein
MAAAADPGGASVPHAAGGSAVGCPAITGVPGTGISDAGGPVPRWMLAVVVAAVATAWANAFPGAFQFDDYAVIVDNPAVQRWAAFFASMPGIRPLLKASYTLSWFAGGGTPTAFVAFNVAIHAANAVLALLLTERVLALAAPELRPRAGIALATALLFALHPAQTEAVTWIAGRATSLSAFFCLVAIVAWLHGGDRVTTSPASEGTPARGAPEAAAKRVARGSGWRAAAMAAFVAALAVKETAVTVPFALLLLEALRRAGPPADDPCRIVPPRPWRDAWRATRLPFALLALAAVAAWSAPAYRRLAAASLDTRGPLANLAAQVDGVAYLITGPLLRLRVNIDPDIPLTGFGPQWWLAAAVLAALGLVTARALSARPGATAGGDVAGAAEADAAVGRVAWRSPLAGFALAWFLLHLAPTNSLLARFDLANDRQLYLALIGPALLVAAAVPAWSTQRRHRGGWSVVVPALVVATLLGAATIARNRDYASEVALWEATVRATPAKARAWNNLGYAYEQAGRRGDARRAYQQALALDPDHYKARSNLNLLGDP